MPSRKGSPSLDALREAVRARVDDFGLREVAREVGLAHASLGDFLNGRTPRAANVAKLRKWFGGEDNEVVRLRQEVAALRKQVAELEGQLREAKK
jgi:hypothetical protein